MQTTNQIDVKVPRERVVQLYTCRDLLPLWSPGFVAIEVLSDGVGSGLTFRQRYLAMGREIDEVITLVEDNLPDGLHLLADSGGMLTRASETTFEALSAGATRVVVRNTFSGEHLPYLVESDLHGYTQSFLETFRDFAQGRGAP